MPKWTYKLDIINATGRDLELVSSSIPWGGKEFKFPKLIANGKSGEFSVYSSAGAPTGIEFYFTMRDKPVNEEEPSYGTFSVSVDMPFWKHANKSSFKCTGILTQDGFTEVPDGAHDYFTTATISTKLSDINNGYCDIYQWNEVNKLKIVNPESVSPSRFVPAENILSQRKLLCRTEQTSIPKKYWDEIIDNARPDSYSKKNFVKDYFTMSAYEIRKNTSISISPNQSYNKHIEITNHSTIRRETQQEFQIENTIECGPSSQKFSFSQTLRTQYQISSLQEYCEETSKTTQKELDFPATDYGRTIVFWDFVKIIFIYRRNLNDTIQLVGIGDYLVASEQKDYLTTPKGDTPCMEIS